MSLLFDALKKLDPNFANAWRAQTGDRERALTASELTALLSKLNGLSEGSARGILELAKRKFLPANAEAVFKPFIDKWDQADKLNYVSSAAISKQIGELLGSAYVNKILFKSPATLYSYSPLDYIAVGKLVVAGKIAVLLSNTGGLSNFGTNKATYNSDANVLKINSSDPPARLVSTIHEATHAILDWADASFYRNEGEADSRVAEALAFHAVKNTFPAVDPAKVAKGDPSEILLQSQIEAAKLVLSGKGFPGQPDFVKAYGALVKAVDGVYTSSVGQKAVTRKKGEGDSESKAWQSVKDNLPQTQAIKKILQQAIMVIRAL